MLTFFFFLLKMKTKCLILHVQNTNQQSVKCDRSHSHVVLKCHLMRHHGWGVYVHINKVTTKKYKICCKNTDLLTDFTCFIHTWGKKLCAQGRIGQRKWERKEKEGGRERQGGWAGKNEWEGGGRTLTLRARGQVCETGEDSEREKHRL